MLGMRGMLRGSDPEQGADFWYDHDGSRFGLNNNEIYDRHCYKYTYKCTIFFGAKKRRSIII